MTDSIYVVKRGAGRRLNGRGNHPRLEQLDMELTERCNNDCIHCCINRPAEDADARSREMPGWLIKAFLDQAAELGCLSVRFTGGEPLLRPDFAELYLHARRLGMQVLLFTNACLITPQLCELFAQVPPLALIEITVYGMRTESYAAVTRRPDSYAQFRRGVDLLLKRRVPFVVKSVLLPQLEPEREEFEAWAATLPGMTLPPNYSLFLDLRCRRDNARKNEAIASLRPSTQDALSVLTRNEAAYRRDMAQLAARFMGPPGDRLFSCGAINGLCIDAYGRAQSCIGVRAPELTVELTPHAASTGEGKPNSPFVLTEGGQRALGLGGALKYFGRFQELRATNPEYLNRCARCFLKGLCEQCPAKSWVEYGTLDTPVAYLCEAAHAQARYLGWLGQAEMAWDVTDWQKRIHREQRPFKGEGASGEERPNAG